MVEFASASDRDYYAKSDPSHLGFVKSLGGILDKVIVVDFTDGDF